MEEIVGDRDDIGTDGDTDVEGAGDNVGVSEPLAVEGQTNLVQLHVVVVGHVSAAVERFPKIFFVTAYR